MNKINIIIPMAGRGSRFEREGYKDPKPFIDVIDKKMIEWVIDNLKFSSKICHFIFICREEHLQKYNFSSLLNKHFEGSLDTWEIISINYLTNGALCTALKSRNLVNNEIPLLIANSDQWLNWSTNNFINLVDEVDCDGAIVTSFSNHPKWSYVKINDNGYITQVKEKEVISNICNTGIFYYKKGKDFVEAADDLIHRDERVGDEYYIAPTYNYLIRMGKKIINYPISNHAFHGLGIPEDLQQFIKYMSKFYESEEEMARRLI